MGSEAGGGEADDTVSVLLQMDNFPGSQEWPPLDEPGVLGRAHHMFWA